MSFEGAMRHKKKIAAAAGLAVGLGAYDLNRVATPTESTKTTESRPAPLETSSRSLEERAAAKVRAVEVLPEEDEDEWSEEQAIRDALPEFSETDLGPDQLLDLPEKDLTFNTRYSWIKNVPSVDKRIYDASAADPEYGAQYEALVHSLEWEVDGDFLRVTSPAEYGNLDLSFQIEPKASQEGLPPSGWQVTEYVHDEENGLVLSAGDDPNAAVVMRLKVALEAALPAPSARP